MHIGHINLAIEIYSSRCGGAVSTVIMQQTAELLAQGHEVTVFSAVDGDATYRAGRVLPLVPAVKSRLPVWRRAMTRLSPHRHQWDWPYYEHFARSVAKQLKQLRPLPDVLVVHNDLMLPGLLKKWAPDVPVVGYLHNLCETRGGVEAGRAAVASMAGVVCVSGFVGQWVVEKYGADPAKVFTNINGVDTGRFCPINGWPGSHTPPRILFVGRMTREKGPDVVLEAFEHLRQSGVACSLELAGDKWWYDNQSAAQDPYRASVWQQAQRSGATWRGHVEREAMPGVYAANDIVCAPARWDDPCPLVPLEGMASGCAVVTTRRGGIPEACDAAATYVEADSPASLAQALRELVTHPAALAAKKQAALERARAMHWSHNARRMADFLKQCV